MRMPSPATLAVLASLLEHPQASRYGYELIQTTGVASGTLYPILMRLHDRGLVEAEWRTSSQAGPPPRQVYRLTPAGLEYAGEHVSPQSEHDAARQGREPT
ncbi:MAG: PadR family transcriptional regulator [Oceanicaulis sp.]